MCGIAGIFYPRSSDTVEVNQLHRMTSVLVHRGPDEGDVYSEGPIGLGHRRLSIIDLTGGKQPIFNEDRTMAIVFNGELYNFQRLRETLLQRGHRFITNSDTEVILHAYEEYGSQCVRHLRGMFAFAVWDGRKNSFFSLAIVLALSHCIITGTGKSFSSARRSKLSCKTRQCNEISIPHALDEYLTYLYIPAPRTIFQQIYKLRPGHTLTVSECGLKEEEYWDLTFQPESDQPEHDVAEGVLEKLRESVSVHLMSEVPLGAFLSGGIDSSAVVAIMAGLLDQPVNTASIGFREAEFDESPYARAVAQQFQTNAYEKTVEADAAKILETLAWHFDEPFADSSMVPTYYVSQVARERVTVCLSGDGGDENFAGYRRYRFDVFENAVRKVLPQSLRGPLFGTLGCLYPKADWLPRIFRGKNASHESLSFP